IGDALSHAILPGVVIAFVVVGYSALGFFVGAVVAGLLAAILITWIQQNVETKNDAAIGIVFTAMFSLGVMGISYISQNEGVHLDLKDFLFGNVLGVSDQDLWLTLGITIYVILSILLIYRYLLVSTFQPIIAETMGISVKVIHYFLMLLLSFAVVASLQTVGVILVVAMLITPAATALLLANRLPWVLVIAGSFGVVAAVSGLLVAIWLETTPGPAMAVMATLLYLVAVLFAPQKGLLSKMLQRRALRRRIVQEDVLKQAYRLEQAGKLSIDHLLDRLSIGPTQLQRHLQRLRAKKWIELKPLHLTPQGQKEARRFVRAHRLWETYLVNQMGLTTEQIHEDAEHYEHLLTEDILDEVEAQLGYPALDPHGSPIPSKLDWPANPLIRLLEDQTGKIAAQQLSEQISVQLW
ncbi:MAG: metal ABC transporter permease, partial [Phaeodactylibacter sp.]|nr:metal ABC transporter permease [Phaeodactylibacter sp.]